MFIGLSQYQYLLCKITKKDSNCFGNNTRCKRYLSVSKGKVLFQKKKPSVWEDFDCSEFQYWALIGTENQNEFLIRNFASGYFLYRNEEEFILTEKNTMFTWTMEELEYMLDWIDEETAPQDYKIDIDQTLNVNFFDKINVI